jgi:lipopolysaccharide export system protein LptC
MHRMKLRLREAWDRFLLYVPMVCMAVLALGTYWMVRTTPAPGAPQAKEVERHDPDYYMEGFTLKSFDAKGRMRSEVMGDKARHYADNAWTEIDQVRFRSFDEKGRLTTATANRGLSNEDGSEVQLIGNAIVVREAEVASAANTAKGIAPAPRMEYRGEFLHAFMATERLKSHKPVELTRGNDRFTADAMDFDNVEQVINLQGRVRGTLTPAKQIP